MLSHGTMSPIVRNPELLEELSPYAVDYSIHKHPASTHPDKKYSSLFIGLETGSPRLFNQFMKGKAYPYKAEQWHDVVLKGNGFDEPAQLVSVHDIYRRSAGRN